MNRVGSRRSPRRWRAGTRSEQLEEAREIVRGTSLVAIDEIDERVEPPLVSLGREVSTPVGAIDNLFLSRNGYLVIVETKLCRNPEARRQVAAQLIDYAACRLTSSCHSRATAIVGWSSGAAARIRTRCCRASTG